MFNIQSNIYLVPYALYAPTKGRYVFAKKSSITLDVTPFVEPSKGESELFEEYIKTHFNEDYSEFFRKVFQSTYTQQKANDRICIYADPINMIKIMTIWYSNVFTNHTFEHYRDFLNCQLRNQRLTYIDFFETRNNYTQSLIKEYSQFAALCGDEGKLQKLYDKFSNIKLDRTIKETIYRNLPIDYLLYFKAKGKDISTDKLSLKLKRMLLSDYLNDTFFETRSRILSCLPIIHKVIPDLSLDINDPFSYFEVMNHPDIYYFFGNSDSIPVGDITLDIQSYNRIVKIVNGDNRIDGIHEEDPMLAKWDIMLKGDFSYDAVVKAIKDTKGYFNVLFRNYKFWDVINHELISCFINVILDKENVLPTEWLEDISDDLFQEWR